MSEVSTLRGGTVRRYGQYTLVSDIPDAEITKPTAALIAAVKANDQREIERLCAPQIETSQP